MFYRKGVVIAEEIMFSLVRAHGSGAPPSFSERVRLFTEYSYNSGLYLIGSMGCLENLKDNVELDSST